MTKRNNMSNNYSAEIYAKTKKYQKIKEKYHKMQEYRNKKYPVFGKNNTSNKSSGNGTGKWVTINGNHVYIE